MGSRVTALPAAPGFGQTLRTLRHERGWSQYRLARRLFCTLGYISRLESGARTPSREFVEDLSAEFNLGDDGEALLLGLAGFSPKVIRSGDLVSLAALLEDPAVPLRDRQEARAVVIGLACWLDNVRRAAQDAHPGPVRDAEPLKGVHLSARENGVLGARNRAVEAMTR